MTDDLDPRLEADESITFGVDGATYEIDLSKKNATALRSALDRYVRAARRTGGRAARGHATPTKTGVDTAAVKAWADSNGVAYNKRGRLPATIIEQFRQAMD